MPRTVITGASRGIGHALAIELAGRGHNVLALCRKPVEVTGLAGVDGVTVRGLDVASPVAMHSFATSLDGTIDILVNNAGIAGGRLRDNLSEADFQMADDVFRVNAVAPLLLTRLLADRLASGALVVNVTSIMGSNASNTSGGMAIYRASKAALNSITRTLAAELGPQDVTVLAVHPGWVRTDMGGPSASIDKETSARGIAQVIADAEPSQNGTYLDWKGDSLPW